MRKGSMGVSSLLALAAVIVFFLAAIGSWPDGLADDVEPVAFGLALLAASFVLSS